jgi:hypothetical protein
LRNWICGTLDGLDVLAVKVAVPLPLGIAILPVIPAAFWGMGTLEADDPNVTLTLVAGVCVGVIVGLDVGGVPPPLPPPPPPQAASAATQAAAQKYAKRAFTNTPHTGKSAYTRSEFLALPLRARLPCATR